MNFDLIRSARRHSLSLVGLLVLSVAAQSQQQASTTGRTGRIVGRIVDQEAGTGVTDAGVHPAVTRVVYVSAFALDAGESVMENDLTGGEEMTLADALVFDGDVVTVDPERAVEYFFHDCAPDVAASAVAQLRPMSVAALACPARTVAWREKPSTFVLCADDRALPVALQQSSASRASEVVEIGASHSPFLSRPDELVRVLLDITSR